MKIIYIVIDYGLRKSRFISLYMQNEIMNDSEYLLQKDNKIYP